MVPSARKYWKHVKEINVIFSVPMVVSTGKISEVVQCIKINVQERSLQAKALQLGCCTTASCQLK